MTSDHVNRLFSVLGALLVYGLVLGSVTDAHYNSEYNQRGAVPSAKGDAYVSTLEECNRECQDDEPPKICYHHFTLELYSVLGGACQLCTPNATNTASSDCQCVEADGVERTILTVNRMIPGPAIQVCIGDKVVIDVLNHMDGMEISIHWHGIFQKGSQYFDGVPLVTQCPIMLGNTFRYQWYADNEGTHFWHSHTGLHKMDGIHGSLIVRVPRSQDPNSEYYDYDLSEHVILFADWMHELTTEHYPGLLNRNPSQHPVSVLINGKGKFRDPITDIVTNISLANFVVTPGKRYRMRLINAFCSSCPAQLIFEGHTPLLIAVDGVPVKPVKINSINSVAGERFDVVITADEVPRCYWIQIRTLGACISDKIQQFATLCYSGEYNESSSAQPTYDQSLPLGVILGPLDGLCNITRNDSVCISQLKSARPVDEQLCQPEADYTFFYEVSFRDFTPQELFQTNSYKRYSVPTGVTPTAALVNNISFISPNSPLLSQLNDVPRKQFCSKNRDSANCGTPCMCTQMEHVPKGAIVEYIFTDGVGDLSLTHPMHMHGYAFNVMGMGKSPDETITKMRAYHARGLDKAHKLRRNFDNPPYKDTVAIPSGGYAIVRFRANNPGFWLIHCHFLFHQLGGMEALLHVGETSDLPPIPPNFPTCGDYLPPIVRDRC